MWCAEGKEANSPRQSSVPIYSQTVINWRHHDTTWCNPPDHNSSNYIFPQCSVFYWRVVSERWEENKSKRMHKIKNHILIKKYSGSISRLHQQQWYIHSVIDIDIDINHVPVMFNNNHAKLIWSPTSAVLSDSALLPNLFHVSILESQLTTKRNKFWLICTSCTDNRRKAWECNFSCSWRLNCRFSTMPYVFDKIIAPATSPLHEPHFLNFCSMDTFF